jgi:hypothetical protein
MNDVTSIGFSSYLLRAEVCEARLGEVWRAHGQFRRSVELRAASLSTTLCRGLPVDSICRRRARLPHFGKVRAASGNVKVGIGIGGLLSASSGVCFLSFCTTSHLALVGRTFGVVVSAFGRDEDFERGERSALLTTGLM